MTPLNPSLVRRGIVLGGWWPVSEWLSAVFVFLLPWQARWIYAPRQLNGSFWEYGSLSLYATEALLWVMLVAMAWGIVRQGSTGWPRPSWGQFISSRGAVVLGSGGLLLVTWLSLFWADDRTVALQTAFRLSEGFALLFVLLLAAPAARYAARGAFVVAAGLQGALALIQFFSQTVFGSTWLGMDAQSAGELGASVLELADGRWLRAYGTFPHPNILAGFLVFGLLFAAQWYRERFHSRQRMVPLVCGMFAAIGLTLTFSRAATAALIFALVGWGIVASGVERRVLVRFFSHVAVVALLLVAMLFPLVTLRLSGQGRLEVKSLAERQSLEQQTRQLVRFSRWRGVGAGNATFAAFRQDPGLPGWAYQPIHQVARLVRLELGVAGLATLALFLLGLLAHGISRRQGTVVAVTVALVVLGLTDHYLWSLYPGLMVAISSLGLAVVVPRPT